MKAQFTVGDTEKIIIDVYCAVWSGLQIYKTNGEVVHRLRSFRPNDVIEFSVGERETHKIRIVLKSIPKASSEVYVDGELYIETLFKDIPSWNTVGTWDAKKARKWKNTLKKGKWHYLLIRSSLYWGGAMVIGMSVLNIYGSPVPVDVARVVSINLVIWPLFGFFLGMFEWRSNNKKYYQYQSKLSE